MAMMGMSSINTMLYLISPDLADLGVFVCYLLTFCFIVFLVYIVEKERRKTIEIPSFKVDNLTILSLACIAMISLQQGIILPVISLIPIPEFLQDVITINNTQYGAWTTLTLIILAPVFEEYIFRGVMLKGLLKTYSPTKAIIATSLLFGLIHLNPWQFVVGTSIGLLCGWVYYKTRSLTYPIVIHLANNLFAILPSFLIPNATDTDTSLAYYYGGMTLVLFNILIAIITVGLLSWMFKKQEEDILLFEENIIADDNETDSMNKEQPQP